MHQPLRVRPYSLFEIGERHDYFDSHESSTDNEAIFHKVAHKSYHPMIALLKKLADSEDNFSVNLSITGTFMEQCAAWDEPLLREVQALVGTGKVEIVAETYYHSLAFFYSRFEFEKQVRMHREMVEHYFGQIPVTFRNTELAYNNDLAYWADQAGYKAILAEGWDPVLGWKSPHYVYNPAYTDTIALFLKDYKLSDDLAFRFSNRSWNEWPLDAGKYRAWIDALPAEESLINLFMDFETFGEHQWADTGIFDFFESFVHTWCADGNAFKKFADALEAHTPVGSVDMPQTVTWADSERDLTAWLGNPMQVEAIRVMYELEDAMLRCGDADLLNAWRYLQTSDNFYYMCTKWFNDGDVHAYFSPYSSPYDAFLYFMNAVRDVRWRLLEHTKGGF